MADTYDVAISFLATDEPLAEKLAGQLEGKVSIFLYSERQRELAGTDGVDKFSQAFGADSKVVVALYREGWGQSTWTRVEEEAIKSRGITSGWDFLLVISLDGQAPRWLPRPQLWLGWERFGIEASIAVIERKVTEAGGEIRAESAVERARRIGQRQEFEQQRSQFLRSQYGVDLATVELAKLFKLLEAKAEHIHDLASALGLALRRLDSTAVAITSPGYSVSLAWSQQWANSLEHASLVIRERAGPFVPRAVRGAPVITRGVHATFTLDEHQSLVWVHDDEPERAYSTEALSERYLRVVMDHAQDPPRRTRHAPDDELE